MRKAMVTVGLIGAVAVAVVPGLMADDQAKGVTVGQAAPDFKLFGTDYKYHWLGKYADKKALVVAFWCNSCPVVVSYEDRFSEIARAYQPKGVAFLAINPNPADVMPADGFPQMIERAKQKNFPFPYVYDETQEVARAYGATVTPHIFLLVPKQAESAGEGESNTTWHVAYTGAIDNRHKAPHYLADALDAVLAGKEIPEKTTAQFGCTVKYRQTPPAE